METTQVVKSRHSKFIKKTSFINVLMSLLFIFVLAGMVINPKHYIILTLNAILIWATVVLPGIFPFLIYSKLLTHFGFVDFFSKILSPITKFLFNTDGNVAYIYLMSILSGYPIGAKLVSDLYLDGRINKGCAYRAVAFCSNSGPMFILGSVGIGMLFSKLAGYIILISHFVGAIINGLLFRKYKLNDTTQNEKTNKEQTDDNFLYSTALSSTTAMLVVGAYIVLFFILIEFLNIALNIDPSTVFGSVFNGIFEITRGCKDISTLSISLSLKTILCCGIISFGGFSTAIQSLAFLKKAKISTWYFILQKFTHGIISTIICSLILLFVPL